MKDKNNSTDKSQGLTYTIKDGKVTVSHGNGYTMTYHIGEKGIEVSYLGEMPYITHASDH